MLIVLFCIACITTLVYTFLVQVPYVPTPKKAVREMVKAAELKDGQVIYDLGAGDGRFLIEAKKECPGITAIGYELVPAVWLLGKFKTAFSRHRVKLQWRDALKEDISDADCLFLYLIPNVLPKYVEKFEKELRPGTKIYSHGFQIPGMTPVETKQIPGFGWFETKMYVYQW